MFVNLQKPSSVNEHGPHGLTPLMLAARGSAVSYTEDDQSSSSDPETGELIQPITV